MAKKMIEGGELVPSCNFEVDWSGYDTNEITDEKSLFEILKEFLWNRSEKSGETYPMFDLNIANNKGEQFEESFTDKGTLIPNPTKEQPFQLINEHTLEDAIYAFGYVDKVAPLSIEYQTYDNQKLLIGITQKGKNCEYDYQGDGGTQDQFITFRFLNKKGEIQSIRSSAFAPLPLEFTDESEKSDIKNLQVVAKKFFSELKSSLNNKDTPTAKLNNKDAVKAKYFEFKDKDSSKFWKITVIGKKVNIQYGKIGTSGQNTVKELATPGDANKHAEKVISEKIKKGYKEKKN